MKVTPNVNHTTLIKQPREGRRALSRCIGSRRTSSIKRTVPHRVEGTAHNGGEPRVQPRREPDRKIDLLQGYGWEHTVRPHETICHENEIHTTENDHHHRTKILLEIDKDGRAQYNHTTFENPKTQQLGNQTNGTKTDTQHHSNTGPPEDTRHPGSQKENVTTARDLHVCRGS